MSTLQNATVWVLGLGDSGLAMALWCARAGAQVQVWDTRGKAAPQAAALAEQLPAARWVAVDEQGLPDDAALQGVARVFKSPGLSPLNPQVAPLLARLTQAGLRAEGELDLFAEALLQLRAERGYAPHVLAITGTNGKTTTASLTALLVARVGLRVALAGNIGPTMLQTLAEALDLEPATPRPVASVAVCAPGHDVDQDDVVAEAELVSADDDTPVAMVLPDPPPPAPVFQHLPEVWVLELSSFQLESVHGFEPSAAAVLNISEDHLDWHGTLAAYQAAKAKVWGERAVVVVNRDDAAVRALVPAPQVLKSVKGRPARSQSRQVVSFGLAAPQQPGDYGLIEENGVAWLVRAGVLEEGVKRSRSVSAGGPLITSPEELSIHRLMPADALRIRGRHNAANALAALALAGAIGCPLGPMLHGLREYAGESHRVEHVANWQGVDAFDDSKGTNVGATVAALLGLGADRAPAKLVVILGGDGKGQDFSALVEPVRRHARAVATLGRDAALIEQALLESGVPFQRHATLQAATRWCFAQAQVGDAVLLSPACASLDMFRNYAHRAEVFVAEVQALMADSGGVTA